MAKMHNNEARPTDLKYTDSASVVLICYDKTQTQIAIIIIIIIIIITKILSLLRRYAVSTGKYLPTL